MEDQSDKDELIRMLVDGGPITARNLMDDRLFVEFLHFVHYCQIVWMERNLDWALRDTKYSVVPSWLESKASKLLEWKLRIVTWIPRHDEMGRISFLGLLGRNNPNDWDNELSDKERFYLCTDDNGGILTKYNSEGVCSIVGSLIG